MSRAGKHKLEETSEQIKEEFIKKFEVGINNHYNTKIGSSTNSTDYKWILKSDAINILKDLLTPKP